MTTYKQGYPLVLKASIEYVNPRTNRRNKLKQGTRVWTASTQLHQTSTGTVEICKEGRPMGTGLCFALEIVEQYFEPIAPGICGQRQGHVTVKDQTGE